MYTCIDRVSGSCVWLCADANKSTLSLLSSSACCFISSFHRALGFCAVSWVAEHVAFLLRVHWSWMVLAATLEKLGIYSQRQVKFCEADLERLSDHSLNCIFHL